MCPNPFHERKIKEFFFPTGSREDRSQRYKLNPFMYYAGGPVAEEFMNEFICMGINLSCLSKLYIMRVSWSDLGPYSLVLVHLLCLLLNPFPNVFACVFRAWATCDIN